MVPHCREGLLGVLLVWLLPICGSFADETETEKLEIQPNELRSILKSDASVRDKDFTKWTLDMFVQEGEIRLLHATFVFQQCFGGGFLDNLKFSYGRGIKWVGGSASKHSQRAIGTISQAESDARPADKRPPAVFIEAVPMSLWTKALLTELAANQTVLNAFKAAEIHDAVGPNAVAPLITLENPQWSSGSGGEEIELADPQATVRHAIIWGGRNGRRRHYENMAAIRDLLISKWGSPGGSVTIAMFYGDGVHGPGGLTFPTEWAVRAATDEGLRQYTWTLKPTMSETTQFFFYGTGHGSSGSALPAPVKILAQGVTESEEFTLSPAEMRTLESESGSEFSLYVTYEDFLAGSGEVSVTLNDVMVGTISPALEPGEETVQFSVPKSLLAVENTISVHNGSDATFTQVEIEYDLGDIADDPPRLVCDYDGDGDVDPSDFAEFQLCATGPSVSYRQAVPPGCPLVPDANEFIAADFDHDYDVDPDDFAWFQRCSSGEQLFADPNCLY